MSSQPLASPLSWPHRQPRTRFRLSNPLWRTWTVATASVEIEKEVRLLGGVDLVLSSNLALRIDGFPRSGQPEPVDPGVAVYFTRKKQPLVFACDAYRKVVENMRAISMHLGALRGMERWGVGTLDQAFAGYAELPENGSDEAWWSILGCTAAPSNLDELQILYRDAAKRAHPDAGGSHERFVRVQRAFEKGREILAAT